MRFFEFKNPFSSAPSLAVPDSRQGPAVADVQKVLVALGYPLPDHGVDGIRGPETVAAIKQFQQDNKLLVDGDPGVETVAALNKIIDDQGIKFTKSTDADVKAPAVASLASLPPLSTDAATSGKVGEVLNFIARFESKGNYNVILGGSTAPLTKMTIAQVYELQNKMINSGMESSAVGRYQYIGTSLREMVKALGLDPNTTKFDEKTQDAIAIADMRRRCGLDDWLSGKLPDDAFLNKLSRVWASIPNTKTGGSTYAGVGSNKAGTKVDVALNTLQDIKAA
jgi:conjugal transfer mating pair stabilization protein TraG